MAKALASPSFDKDLQEVNHFESDHSDTDVRRYSDSEDDEDETEDNPHSRSPRLQASRGQSPNNDVHSRNTPDSQPNGSVMMQFDRYGFVGGKEFTDPDEEKRVPIEVIRKREIKWLDMFQNWEKWMSKRFKKVKERCRKGIPPSVRSRAWQYLCGSKFLMDHNVGKFDEYLRHPGDPKWIEDIKKDLHRQFPLHEMFMARGGHGQEDLFRILKAYTIHNPRDGYCQAQGPLAAVLLMHMPAEEAFWCFVSICDKYLPGYYSPGLEAIQVDGDVLFGLLKKTNPPIYKHLKKHRVEPILYMTEWFMCVFSRTLPWSCVLRVWDMFFCEGVKVIFRVGLVLIRTVLGSPESLKSSPGLYETLEKIRHIPPDIDEAYIVRESLRLSITERDMEKEHQKQVQRRKAAKEKQNRPDSSKKTNKKRH